MQPYYNGYGGPPPSYGNPSMAPSSYYGSGAPAQQPPPGYYQQHQYGAPPPMYGGGGYGEDPYPSSRGGPPPPNPRGRRGRSRSPDRGGGRDRREWGGSAPRGMVMSAAESHQRITSSVLIMPSDKPGEVTYSLLVPAFGITALLPGFKDVATANSVTIQLLDESQGGSATRRCLRFTGSWDKLRTVQKQLLETLKRENMIHEEAAEASTLVLISKDRAHNLSSSLADIQQATNTTIEVFPARGGPDASIALVVISSRREAEADPAEGKEEAPPKEGEESLKTARKEDELQALQRIKETLDVKMLPSELPEQASPFYKLHIPVASRFAGSVIGKHAQIVRDLQDETGARINISREGTKAETPTEVYRFVTAEGTGEQVHKAHARIMQFIKEAQDRAREEARDGNMYRVPLAVPDNLIGVIIGRSGKVLKDLQEDTGCRIHIEHSGKDDRTSASSRLVEISGEEDKVQSAQVIVIERLVQAMQDQAHAPTSSAPSSRRARSRSPPSSSSRGYGDRGGYAPSTSSSSSYAPRGTAPSTSLGGMPEGEVESMTVGVPLHQAGAIIGNRGDTVRQICEQSGARIHMEERDKLAPDATERAVTITGTSAQVAKAFTLVQAALASTGPPPPQEPRRGGGGYERRGGPPPRGGGGGGGGYAPPSAYGGGGSLPPLPSTPVGNYSGYGSAPYPSVYGQSSAQMPPAPQQSSYYGSQSAPTTGGGSSYYPSGHTLPPYPSSGYSPQPPPQQQQQGNFDMSILTQLAKNLPPIGSGVITQITGSPQNPNNIQQASQSNGYRGPYM